MHENREISSTPWSDDQGRSAKAKSRTADMYVPEKSDCAALDLPGVDPPLLEPIAGDKASGC